MILKCIYPVGEVFCFCVFSGAGASGPSRGAYRELVLSLSKGTRENGFPAPARPEPSLPGDAGLPVFIPPVVPGPALG